MILTYRISKLSIIPFLNADERCLRTAFHEAGHDSIARHFGATIDSVHINSAGESSIDITGIQNVEVSTAIAVAGFLAEARGIACSPLGRLARHINVQRVTELAETILDSLDSPEVIAQGRFKLLVPLYPGGRSAEEAEPSVVDFADARARGMTQVHLSDALRSVSDKLNDDGYWPAVVETMEHFRRIDVANQ